MELREKIAEIVAERMFASDVRAKAQFAIADAILAIPEIAEALAFREIQGRIEGRILSAAEALPTKRP